jgi:hypothetical protein
VPITLAQFTANVQGYHMMTIETVPGTPAPTSGYSITLPDFASGDLASGQLSSLSATATAFFAASTASPPITGSFSLKINGQNVANAQGKVLIYLGPVTFVNAQAGSPGPTGPAGPAGPAGSAGGAASAANYVWSQTPGGTLTAGVSNTVNLSPCPTGVAGSESALYVYISGGTGTAEATAVTGGTCTSGLAAGGTIIFTPANNHSGAFTIGTATAGGQEAAYANPAGAITYPAGTNAIFAPLTLSPPTTASSLTCASWGSIIELSNATQIGVQMFSSNPSSVIGCYFESSGTQTGGSAIQVGNGSTDNSFGARISRNNFQEMYNGVVVTAGADWNLTDNIFSSSNADLIIENVVNSDQGDNYIAGNAFEGFGAETVAAIEWLSGSGVKFVGNKIVATFPIAVDLVCNGSACSDIIIANNSIESYGTTGINIANSGGTLVNVQIECNQLAGGATSVAISLAGASGHSVLQTIINGNTMSSGETFLALGEFADDINVTNNLANLGSSALGAFIVMNSANAAQLQVANNNIVGNSATNPYGSLQGMLLTQIGGMTGVEVAIPQADLPASVQNGSKVLALATAASTPCTAGATAVIATFVSGAWNCLGY